MSRTLKFGLSGVLVVGVLAALLVSGTAFAQQPEQADAQQAPALQRGGFGWPDRARPSRSCTFVTHISPMPAEAHSWARYGSRSDNA